MNNYFKADLKRIRANHGHGLCLAVIYLVIAVVAVFKCSDAAGYVGFAQMAASSLPAYLGIIVFFAVFSADTKTRTMQVAIGRGMTRVQVVLAKVLEGLYLTVVYFVLTGLILTVVPLVLQAGVTSADMIKLWSTVAESILSVMLFFNLGMILIIATLKSNLAEIFYVLCGFEIIPGAVLMGLGFLHVQMGLPDLTVYLYTSLLSSFVEQPLTNIISGLGVVVWLLATLFIAITIFRKKELEF